MKHYNVAKIVVHVFQVNNVSIQLPLIYGTRFAIQYNGNFVRFETPFGLTVESDGDRYVVVKVPVAQFAGKVRGMCGNADGKADNDLEMAVGLYVGNATRSGDLIGWSYVDWWLRNGRYSTCARHFGWFCLKTCLIMLVDMR